MDLSHLSGKNKDAEKVGHPAKRRFFDSVASATFAQNDSKDGAPATSFFQ